MSALPRIVAIITPILLIVLIGYLYARRHKPDLGAMNTLTVDLLSPMLVFSSLTGKDFDLIANRWLLAGGLLVVLGSGVIGAVVAKLIREDRRSFVPPMMFTNTGNMGLPLALLAFGPAHLPASVALFVLTSILHFTLGARLVNPTASLGAVLRSPMVLAAIAGIACNLASLHPPPMLALPLKLLGDAAIPLMLFSLGARMTDVSLRGWRTGLVGAVICPLAGLAIAALVGPWLPIDAISRGQLWLFASLPPAVLNFLIAERHGQEPDKVASIVLLGNLASLGFVPVGLMLALEQ
ncbi:AEC family transporter [Parachitinimonas caeni]|uniref:AEC family transporter n=1 Tax=Parachitinimonas caeni TaxID=3031301 RepID=A0ABT7DUL7_9NEIS|nr:AEC family transporter [Parachitinimonas caeni]MDK2122815.1 AEC family transporter [Parachitinimonas caeni]